MTLRRQGDRMSEEQIASLVQHWLEAELDYGEDCRGGPVSDDYRESQLRTDPSCLSRRMKPCSAMNYGKIGNEAHELLKVAGLASITPVLTSSGCVEGSCSPSWSTPG